MKKIWMAGRMDNRKNMDGWIKNNKKWMDGWIKK